jgi:hypothetical protein
MKYFLWKERIGEESGGWWLPPTKMEWTSFVATLSEVNLLQVASKVIAIPQWADITFGLQNQM